MRELSSMRTRADKERRQAALRTKVETPPEPKRSKERRTRESKAFARMGVYLARQAALVEEERRVTQLYSISSSWRAIEEAFEYDAVSLIGIGAEIRSKAIERNQVVFGSQRLKQRNDLSGKGVVRPIREQQPVLKELQANGRRGNVLQDKQAA